VTVLSQSDTDFTGTVLAMGQAGGGSIEVSSHGTVTDRGAADTSSGGTLLLDPGNLTISSTTGVFPQFSLVDPQPGGVFGTQVLTLSTGNIVVTDPNANNNAGAVYLFNGQTGALISTLTGSTGGTRGDRIANQGVTALGNGNFVVDSEFWNNFAGAVTWGSGTTGVSGAVSASNSLVGRMSETSTSNGDEVGSSGQGTPQRQLTWSPAPTGTTAWAPPPGATARRA
jgi:hypothetical protein